METGPRILKPAPAWSCQAWYDGFKKNSLADYKGKWVVLFFYPLDFTFVCPTEIIAFSDRAKTFRSIGCEVVGCSIDSAFSHMEYCKKPRSEGGLGDMDIPLLADTTHAVVKAYHVEKEDDGIAFRATFIIDPNGILRHMSINDTPVGRNIDEIFRLVQAFQYADENGEVCPAAWTPGKKTMKPNPNDPKTVDYWKSVHANQGH